jgi:hypothetical protein
MLAMMMMITTGVRPTHPQKSRSFGTTPPSVYNPKIGKLPSPQPPLVKRDQILCLGQERLHKKIGQEGRILNERPSVP